MSAQRCRRTSAPTPDAPVCRAARARSHISFQKYSWPIFVRYQRLQFRRGQELKRRPGDEQHRSLV